jgi:hypothetical protein
MIKEDQASKILNMINKKGNTTTSTEIIQEEILKIIITKEIIIMAILDKEMKDQITFSILKEWNREKDHLTIIQKGDFKIAIKDIIVHMEIKMIKREDIKTEEAKILKEIMVVFLSKKMIDAIIVRKRVTLLESARSLQGITIET